MNDVAALPDGHWQWNGWLTAKGRVTALFALLRLDAETLWLLLPDTDPAELAAQLQRYVFRSKVVLSPKDVSVAGRFSAPSHAAGNRFAPLGEGWIELDMGGEDAPRSLRIGPIAAPDDIGALAHWDAFDLAHGLPRLPASQAGQWTPQQLSLERLRAFSVSKGCYPGQEIVARTHFLGQAKRGLGLFESEAPLPVGSEVSEDGRGIGTLFTSLDKTIASGIRCHAASQRGRAVALVGHTLQWTGSLWAVRGPARPEPSVHPGGNCPCSESFAS